MNSAIVALVRGEPLQVDEITVTKPEQAIEAMKIVIARAQAIEKVTDAASQSRASLAAQELQGLRKGLKANYDLAKAPINSAGRALDAIFHELDGPMEVEYKRITREVAIHQAAVQRERDMAQARVDAKRIVDEKRVQAKLEELKREKEQLQMRLKLAEEEAERKRIQAQVNRAEVSIESKNIELQLQRENVPLPPEEIPEEKLPGGRNWTKYLCTCTDPIKLFQSHPELIKWELRQSPAQSLAKHLDETGKALDSIPGLQIQKEGKTSFGAATAIRVHGE
jgi:uncharacterized protein YdaU (DUF1376 family)